MILQELVKYYDRLVDSGFDLPKQGFSNEKIHYVVVLDENGRLIQIDDIQDSGGKKKQPSILDVPAVQKKGIKAAFLWDNAEYVFGVAAVDSPNTIGNKWGITEKTKLKHQTFKQFHSDVAKQIDNKELFALVKFLESWDPSFFGSFQNCEEIIGKNVAFQILVKGCSPRYLHNVKSLREFWAQKTTTDIVKGICLIEGCSSTIARVHPPIKGSTIGAQPSSAIVGFNESAYESYRKTQSYNSPISERAAFAYTTVLNMLLTTNRQRIKIADTAVVFWAEKDTAFEDIFFGLLAPQQDDGFSKDVCVYLESVNKGKMPTDIDPFQKFYILGISPNRARISIRFWYVNTVKNISQMISRHFKQIEIEKQFDSQPKYPVAKALLLETAVLYPNKKFREEKDIPFNLAGPFMNAILKGNPYPLSLLSILMERIRAEKNTNYFKCALIKAILIRNYNKEVSVSLDKERTDVAYLLGRLFAVLEKVQEESAEGKINSSIKDKFFASASTHPSVTFPMLIRLSQNHHKKLKSEKAGRAVNLQKVIQSIIANINSFPSYFNLEDQGLFAIGYYHQYQNFFEKREIETTNDNTGSNE